MKSKKGETFDAWINALHSLGYNVDWQVLNAADYGDATSRKRLFVVGSRQGSPKWPDPTHSENGETPGTEPWRPAAEIIDWSER
ncbi:DNA cytosine methyltransferase, partial [Halococcus salifodinae]